MYLDIAGLTNAKDAISSLVFYRWIPPTIKVKNMISRQVETDATGFERENHNWGPWGRAGSGLSFLVVFTGAIQKTAFLDAVCSR